MKKILIIVIVLIIIGAVVFYFYQKMSPKNPVGGIINSVTFNCVENKTVQAIFFSDKVELTLSDGRKMLLPQAISASGARYANTDESFVFWNKGDTAFVEEGNQTTYKDCSLPVSGNN